MADCRGKGERSGRPGLLNIRVQVVVTLNLLRQNVNQTTVADMFGVSQPTISRV